MPHDELGKEDATAPVTLVVAVAAIDDGDELGEGGRDRPCDAPSMRGGGDDDDDLGGGLVRRTSRRARATSWARGDATAPATLRRRGAADDDDLNKGLVRRAAQRPRTSGGRPGDAPSLRGRPTLPPRRCSVDAGGADDDDLNERLGDELGEGYAT